MIKRSSAAEVTRLLAEVAGGDDVRRAAAAARLAIIGPRAVDRVLAALDAATSEAHRAALLGVLEAIGDPRALAAGEAAVETESGDVALAGLSVVCRGLASSDAEVTTRALDVVTRVALDPSRADALRLAALDALRGLGREVAGPVEQALQADPSERVRARAGPPTPQSPAEPDLGRWADDGLPDDPEAVRLAVVEQGPAAPLPTLHHLLTRMRDAEARPGGEDRRARWLAARAATHQVLAERGSRVALYDLRETLDTTTGALPVGMLAALEAIGDAALLDDLALAWSRTTDEWTRDRLGDAFAAIVARHGLTKRHAVMKRVATKYPALGSRVVGVRRGPRTPLG